MVGQVLDGVLVLFFTIAEGVLEFAGELFPTGAEEVDFVAQAGMGGGGFAASIVD